MLYINSAAAENLRDPPIASSAGLWLLNQLPCINSCRCLSGVLLQTGPGKLQFPFLSLPSSEHIPGGNMHE